MENPKALPYCQLKQTRTNKINKRSHFWKYWSARGDTFFRGNLERNNLYVCVDTLKLGTNPSRKCVFFVMFRCFRNVFFSGGLRENRAGSRRDAFLRQYVSDTALRYFLELPSSQCRHML